MVRVLIVIGSKSDMQYAEACRDQLSALGLESDVEVTSAHRHPKKTADLTGRAKQNGYEVIIAMAGLSAALPGVAAAHSNLPVIGVPLPAAFEGLDSLLSIAQMPPGIPVATMGVGTPGARNAAIMAGRILALKYSDIREALEKHRDSL